MDDLAVDRPGSPQALDFFHAWCRAMVILTVAKSEIPTLLFYDGPAFDATEIRLWELEGQPADAAEFIDRVVTALAADEGASQVGVGVPFGGAQPGVLLVSVDEDGVRAEESFVELDGEQMRLTPWEPVVVVMLPVNDWQPLLARNAGYREYARWRCANCESVCPGEADTVPSPCDYCGSDVIEGVAVSTPLAPPAPPYDGEHEPAGSEVLATPFIQTVLGIIRGRPQG